MGHLIAKTKNIPIQYYLFVLMILPCFIFNKTLDDDSYFLLKHGEYIINNGFPTTEPFTMHQNLNFVMQQWLYATIIYYIYNSFGQKALMAFIMIIFIFSTMFLQQTLELICNNKILSYILTFPSTFMMLFFTRTRPIIVTYLLTILLFYSLLQYTKTQKVKWLILLPIISLIQINIQCSMWIFLFVMLLPFVFELKCFTSNNICNDSYNKTPIFITIILMVLIGFLNPYGHKAMTYVFKSISSVNIGISEMATPTILNASGTMIILFTVLSTILFINIKEQINIRYLFLYWGTLALVLFALRNLPFFALAFSFLLAELLKNVNMEKILTNIFGLYKVYIPILTIVCILLSFKSFLPKEENTSIAMNPTYEGINYLVKNYDTENKTAYTHYNNGSYAMYNGLKVYIDARMEIYLYSQNKKFDYIKEFNKLQTGRISVEDFINKYNFDYLILDSTDILFAQKNEIKNYTEIYNNEQCSILIKNNLLIE